MHLLFSNLVLICPVWQLWGIPPWGRDPWCIQAGHHYLECFHYSKVPSAHYIKDSKWKRTFIHFTAPSLSDLHWRSHSFFQFRCLYLCSPSSTSSTVLLILKDHIHRKHCHVLFYYKTNIKMKHRLTSQTIKHKRERQKNKTIVT